MGKRLGSAELELYGVRRTFQFDPPVPVNGEDEAEVAGELRRDLYVYEVELSGSAVRAQVVVDYVVTGTVTFEVEADSTFVDLDEVRMQASGEATDHILDHVYAGDYDRIGDTIDIGPVWDEDGEEVELF